jgi:hypothetical protein
MRLPCRTVLGLLLCVAVLLLLNGLLRVRANSAPVKFEQLRSGMTLAETEAIMGRSPDFDSAVSAAGFRRLDWHFPNGQTVHVAVDRRGVQVNKLLRYDNGTRRRWNMAEWILYSVVSY